MIDLDAARQAFVDALMPDTVTITTTTEASDGGGAPIPGTPTVITTRGRVWTRSGTLAQGGDQVQQRGTYGLALPVDIAVSRAATIGVGGRTLRIVYQPPVTGLTLEQELGLEEVR
jgi:hypothetical protein